MKNQPNEQAGGSSASKGQQKDSNAGENTRNPGREGSEAQRNEQGNRGDSGNRNEQGTETAKQPNSSSKPGAQFDDRPNPGRKDDRKDSKAPGGALPSSGTPSYGDKEPGDPRKLDVDAGTGGRTGSSDRTNRA